MCDKSVLQVLFSHHAAIRFFVPCVSLGLLQDSPHNRLRDVLFILAALVNTLGLRVHWKKKLLSH